MGKRERKTWAPVGIGKVILISAKQGLDWGVCLRPVQDSTELVWYQSQFGTRKAALYGRHLDMTECSGNRLWSARVQNGFKRRANKGYILVTMQQ